MLKNNLTIGVTGAAGFIGSHLCEKLLNEGYKVIGVDNLSKGNLNNIDDLLSQKAFIFKKIDLTDFNNVNTAFKKTNAIVHLAAAKIPRYGDRLTTLLTNTKGTENILEIAKIGRKKVIFASTSDVYGKNPKLPFSEKNDLVLGSPEVARWSYAVSKIFDEHLCYAYWENFKIPFVIIRLFGIYGPRHHRSWWGGPPSLFIDAINNGKTVEIHGTGKQTRSFLYISDAAEAIGKSIFVKEAENKIINIGSTEKISIINLAKFIAKIMDKKLKMQKISYMSFTGKKYEDVINRVPEINLAKKILKWQPKTSLAKGLQLTINWQLQQ